MRPVFIFSLPRSGSTLLQRLITSHDEVSSASEPWVLLPLIYTLKEDGVYAEYSHQQLYKAVSDFSVVLPNGRSDYLASIRNLVLELYRKASKGDEVYFLDKTPRYALVCEEIIELFPEGKFIFLWRNPLSVIASMIETWGGGLWNLYKLKVDLFDGLDKLTDVYEQNKHISVSLKYEDLLESPVSEMNRIFEYLELNPNEDMLEYFPNINFLGRQGDHAGISSYRSISDEPLTKWKKVLNNPVRKAWSKRYLIWLRHDRLKLMGYQLDQQLSALQSLENNYANVISDIWSLCKGVIYCFIDVNILKNKIVQLPEWKWVKRNN